MSPDSPYATPLPDTPKKSSPTKKHHATSSKPASKRFVYLALKESCPPDKIPSPQTAIATYSIDGKAWFEPAPSFLVFNSVAGPDEQPIAVVIDPDGNVETTCLGWANSQAPAWQLVENDIQNTEERHKQRLHHGPTHAEGDAEARFKWATWVTEDGVNVRCGVLRVEMLGGNDLNRVLQMLLLARKPSGLSQIGPYSTIVKEEGQGPWVTLESAYYGKYIHPRAKSMGTKQGSGEDEIEEEEEDRLFKGAATGAEEEKTEDWAGFEEAKPEKGW